MAILHFLAALYDFITSTQYVFLEYFLVGFILLYISLASKFFSALARKHTSYYAAIGSPSYHNPSFSKYWEATKCMGRLLIGFPKDFPEDEQLCDQMDRYCAALVTFVLVAVVVIVIVGFWHPPTTVPARHLHRF